MRRHYRQPGTFVKSHVNADVPMVKRACTDKRKYSTKQRASRAAHASERKSGFETSFYHCLHYCWWYHLYRVKDEGGNFIPVAGNLVPTVSEIKAIQ